MSEWTWVCSACGKCCLRLRSVTSDNISHCCFAKVREPNRDGLLSG